ncbi:MAG: Lrp/AsnC family transcriptional regulator [Gemmatimonadota bacterium]|jgi:Lrp/AsnC family leucine-responsive transcriptional regulator
MLDAIDRRILQLLQRDARVANAAIARDVELAPSAVFQRIRKLEEAGVITGYHAHVDPAALGQGLLAFVTVQTGEGARAAETAGMLAGIPEVLEVHRTVGEDCFFLKVRVRDTTALGALLDEKIQRLAPVASTRTTIALSTAKNEIPTIEAGDGSDTGLGSIAEESTSREDLRAS